MINKSNDLPSFVNETNLPKIVDKLTDASNIKITNNKYGNRVQTVIDKIVEKADDVTKAIKQEVVNDSYSFKVGTGDVDVSADVEDGFGEIGVKGVTYQNILSKDSKNARQFIQKDLNARVKALNSNLIKSSTKYTLVFDVTQINLAGLDSIGLYIQGSITDSSMVKVASVSTVGIYKYVFTSSSKAITNNYFDLKGHASQWENDSTTTSRTLTLANVMLIEGEIDQPTSYFEDIVGVGDKSKNLFNIKDFVEFAKDTTESPFYYPITLEANTQYTFSDSTGMWNGCGFFLELLTDEKEKLFNLIDSNLANRDKFTFTTNAKTQYLLKLYKHNVDKMLSLSTNFQLEKGSTATTYEPYYDGHKIEILSHGKNLLYDTLDAIPSYLGNANDLDVYSVINGKHYYGATGQDYRNTHGSPMLSCKPNTTYSISLENPCRIEVGNPITVKKITDTNDFKTHLTFTTESNQHYMSLKIWRSDYINTEKKYLIGDIQIEESPTPTSYEPYTEDKTQILLDEPLMRLPNGVCDEITRDGKLIRKIKKIKVNRKTLKNNVSVWDFPEDISKNYIRFYRYVKDMELNGIRFVNSVWKSGYCNIIGDNSNGYRQEKEAFGVTGGALGYLSFSIKAEKIPNFDFNNYSSISNQELILDYLEKVDMTVYFEMETPLITDIAPPSLRIFKDGHLTFNTLVSPESSHMVQLNKSAQIERSIREVQGLDNRINVLENNYDNLILFTMSRLNDLELNYTLK